MNPTRTHWVEGSVPIVLCSSITVYEFNAYPLGRRFSTHCTMQLYYLQQLRLMSQAGTAQIPLLEAIAQSLCPAPCCTNLSHLPSPAIYLLWTLDIKVKSPAFCLGAGSNPYIEQWRASPQPESELDETAQISLDVEKICRHSIGFRRLSP